MILASITVTGIQIGNSKDYSDAQDVEAYITEKAEKSVIRPGGASATDVILETFAQ